MATQFEIDNIIVSSGNFTNSLKVSGTGVSVSGHTHTSSNITDFNSAVIAASPEEIVEYATSNDFPVSGVASILYLSTDASKSYRWAGNAYVEIGPSPSFVANHTHSSADITNFNTSVSGLLPNISGSNYVETSFNNNIYTISITGLQPSGNYSVNGHSHTVSNITDFNSSVSGLLPVKSIVGSGNINVASVSGNFTVSSSDLIKSEITNIAGASGVNNIVTISQANYDALPIKDPNTLYFIS